ncbi:MAG TPA: VWA domain-containing protein [Burkholderiales bacterium]|nr:VWA domain-containing protein [Burkholderiales bacterium]
MLIDFFFQLKHGGVPVSLKEFLTLYEALRKKVVWGSLDDFYFLSRVCLVKDESHYDRFDRVFAEYFRGIVTLPVDFLASIPQAWLHANAELLLSDEDKKLIQSLGGWEKLMETLRQRLAEQKERHEGGSKWIGTRGTSPFGAYGYNPEGVRIGQEASRNRSAVKVWDRREYRNLDDSVELGTRNIKVALRRLRRFAREGAPEELDLDDTVRSTARNAGWLDLKLVPERHNAVKVLLFLDIGGSMDDHVRICEELFSAARSEFKHLEYFYFHNCVYESVWKDNRRRHSERVPLMNVLHKYGHDYKLVLVGDATMSPYEIAYPGGSVEHHNEEAGAAWLQRLLDVYVHAAWINPQPEDRWGYYESIGMIRNLMEQRMYPLTLAGLERAMRELVR